MRVNRGVTDPRVEEQLRQSCMLMLHGNMYFNFGVGAPDVGRQFSVADSPRLKACETEDELAEQTRQGIPPIRLSNDPFR